MNKPVWRMNTGQGVPSDLGGRVLYSNGLVSWIRSGHRYFSDSWGLHAGAHICAYQTTRTKAAKYEKKHCWPCDGSGHQRWRNLNICPHCNGKGHRLEAIK